MTCCICGKDMPEQTTYVYVVNHETGKTYCVPCGQKEAKGKPYQLNLLFDKD